MPKISAHTAPQVQDFGLGTERGGDLDGYTVNFVSLHADMDLAPMLEGLPGDRCDCPHWGYVFKGRLIWTFGDREEVFEAGDAFYAPPGHTPRAEAGAEFVQFSPTAELEVVQRAMMDNMRRMSAG